MSWVRYGSFDDDKYIDDNALLVAYLISWALSKYRDIGSRNHIFFYPYRYFVPPTWSRGDMVCLMHELAKEYKFSIDNVKTNPSRLTDKYIKIRDGDTPPEFGKTSLSEWIHSYTDKNNHKIAKVLNRFANNEMNQADLEFLIKGTNWKGQKSEETYEPNLMKIRNVLLNHVMFSGSPQEESSNLKKDIARYLKKFSSGDLSIDPKKWRYKHFTCKYEGNVYTYEEHMRKISEIVKEAKRAYQSPVEIRSPEANKFSVRRTKSALNDRYKNIKILFTHVMIWLEIKDLINIKEYHNNWSAESPAAQHTFEVEIKENFGAKYDSLMAGRINDQIKIEKLTVAKVPNKDAYKVCINDNYTTILHIRAKEGSSFYKLFRCPRENIRSDASTKNYLNQNDDNKIYKNTDFTPTQELVDNSDGFLVPKVDIEEISYKMLKKRQEMKG